MNRLTIVLLEEKQSDKVSFYNVEQFINDGLEKHNKLSILMFFLDSRIQLLNFFIQTDLFWRLYNIKD